MRQLAGIVLFGLGVAVLLRWYQHEVINETEAVVHLQSEHEHFHIHVDLPAGMEIQPGDTLQILTMPKIEGQTNGEIMYTSPARLYKASWLRRNLVKQSSLIEISELVDHP